jgi:hypothetical protein
MNPWIAYLLGVITTPTAVALVLIVLFNTKDPGGYPR